MDFTQLLVHKLTCMINVLTSLMIVLREAFDISFYFSIFDLQKIDYALIT